MTVLLVILTLAIFVLCDYLATRDESRREAAQIAPVLALPTEPVPEPVWVAGYQLPEALHYHRGHTWVRALDRDTAVVGIDDFARRLLGPATGLDLPAPGDRLRPGEPGFAIRVEGRSAALVAPVEGEVLATNPELARHPALATEDPYGRGWILKVRTRNLPADLRNLLSGTLARRWIEDSREGLELRLMALSGTVLQDGGAPVAELARHLARDDWQRLVGELLLT